MYSFRKIKTNDARILQRNSKSSVNNINGWMQYVNVNLSDAQLKKLKTAVKKKTRRTPKLSLKMLHGNDLLHELLLLTARQKTKLRNELNNTVSTDLALSKAPISKLIQSGGFLWSLLSKLVGPLMKSAIPLAKNVLAPLAPLEQQPLQWLMNEFKRKYTVVVVVLPQL